MADETNGRPAPEHTFIDFPGGPPSDCNYFWCHRCGVLKVQGPGGLEYFKPGAEIKRLGKSAYGSSYEPPCYQELNGQDASGIAELRNVLDGFDRGILTASEASCLPLCSFMGKARKELIEGHSVAVHRLGSFSEVNTDVLAIVTITDRGFSIKPIY